MLMMLTSLTEVTAKSQSRSEEGRSIGLAVNESKTKYLASAPNDSSIGEFVELQL